MALDMTMLTNTELPAIFLSLLTFVIFFGILSNVQKDRKIAMAVSGIFAILAIFAVPMSVLSLLSQMSSILLIILTLVMIGIIGFMVYPDIQNIGGFNVVQTKGVKKSKDDKLRCPECGSTQIHVDKKGYGAGKGCCGAFLLGPCGFLCGQMGANQIRKTCLKCNHSW